MLQENSVIRAGGEGNSENLYIRAGNSTRQLTTKEAIEYSKHRWK
jgi:hypothetical protein